MFFDQTVSNRYFFQKETKMCPREYCTPLLQADCFGHRSRSHSKGQIISKCPYAIIVYLKKATKISKISALASKERSNKKNKGTLLY